MYKFYSYSNLEALVKNGDTIAIEGTSLISKAIKLITGESVSHTGIALWLNNILYVVEMDMDKNVMVPLSQYANNHVQVYRHPNVTTEISSSIILALLVEEVSYGWFDIFKLFCYKTLNLSFMTKDTTHSMICTSLNQKCYVNANLPIATGLLTPGELCAQLTLIGKA